MTPKGIKEVKGFLLNKPTPTSLRRKNRNQGVYRISRKKTVDRNLLFGADFVKCPLFAQRKDFHGNGKEHQQTVDQS